MADLGVNPVGKVQRRRAFGQIDGVTVRGEDIHPVRLDIDAQLIGQATDIAQFFVPLQHLAQPRDFLFVLVGPGLDVSALVAPVRANPQLGLFVHGMGANLHFQDLAFRPDHGSMQRAVAVLLGVGDIVVEFLRDMPPQGMDDAQRGIAVAHFRHQYPYGTHVIDLAEGQALALHFAPDRVDVLGPAADVGVGHAGGFQLGTQLVHHIADKALSVEAALMQQGGDLFVLLGLQIAEGQVLQLPLDVADAQAVRQWRINIEHLAGDAVALLVRGIFDRANRAGTFSQLDQCHAHVINHGNQHLAQVFDLALGAQHHRLTGAEAGTDGRHAQYTINQFGHHRTEALADGRQQHLPFAHATIENRGNQGILIQFQIGQYLGDFQPGTKA